MRLYEFFRAEEDRIVEMQALWDIPEVIMHAGASPLSHRLGRQWHMPGPATKDGVVPSPNDAAPSSTLCTLSTATSTQSLRLIPVLPPPALRAITFFWFEPQPQVQRRTVSGSVTIRPSSLAALMYADNG